MQGKWWTVIRFKIRWKVSCSEHTDRWLGTSAKNTSSEIKALKAYFHSHKQTDLPSAYIMVLTLVFWHWQPLED